MSKNGRLFWRNTDDIDPTPILDALAREQGDAWEARQFAALWKETARRAIQSNAFLDSAAAMEQQMAMSESLVAAEAIKRAEKAEKERGEWMRRALDCATAEPRPLTADDITDEMVKRGNDAWSALRSPENTFPRLIVETILRAALTEPPSRPEGAEGVESQIEQWLYEEGPDDSIKARDLRSLADFLAERGVRVTGAES